MMLNKTFAWMTVFMLAGTGASADVLLEDNFNSGSLDTATKWDILTDTGWSVARHGDTDQLRIADSSSLGGVGGVVSQQTFTLDSQGLIIKGDLSRADNNNGGDIMLVLLQDDGGLTVGDLGMMIPRWQKTPRLRQWSAPNTNFSGSGNIWVDSSGDVGDGIVRFELHIDEDNYTLFTSTGPSDLETMVERSSGAHGLGYSSFNLGILVEDTAYSAASHFADNISVAVIPEPAVATMLGMGGVLVLFRRRER